MGGRRKKEKENRTTKKKEDEKGESIKNKKKGKCVGKKVDE